MRFIWLHSANNQFDTFNPEVYPKYDVLFRLFCIKAYVLTDEGDKKKCS